MIAAVALAIGFAVTSAGGASAASATVPSGDHEIVSSALTGPNNSRECLDVTDGSTSAGALIQIFHCRGTGPKGLPQLFDFIPTLDGNYEILNRNSNFCLTPDPATGIVRESLIRQEQCGPPGSGQKWAVLGDPATGFQLANVESGNTLCLSARGGGNESDHDATALEACSTVPELELWHF
ncbi:RICIN domain-containing protein [Catenulispora rubra]|uniref:RICIN domain-containing protein n=1 Tax=Catenulispora rubra TaxID=280293 RepID=UPI0018924F5D|nr:RICIN domain-containing protein [Catenulispora rubra]